MAIPGQTVSFCLQRPHSGIPWGFRLQGGADFTTPLSIQLVNPGSIAEQYGLKPGDQVVRINNCNADLMEHEAAKMEIVRSGDQVEFLIQRGGVRIWKPTITPMSQVAPNEIKSHTLPGEVPPVQKTSLAHADPVMPSKIGVAHNRSARPFGAPAPAPPPAEDDASVVHAQFNTPISLYSAENIADTFVAQTDAMANPETDDPNVEVQTAKAKEFPKPPPVVPPPPPPPPKQEPAPSVLSPSSALSGSHNGTDGDAPSGISPTMKLVQDELEQNQYRGIGIANPNNMQSRSFRMLQTELENGTPVSQIPGVRSVRAPQTKVGGSEYQKTQDVCAMCGMLVTGVFVKVRGRPLHADCFRCAECRKSLKNQGYFWVDEKMYCEDDARKLTQPPDPNLVAVPIYR